MKLYSLITGSAGLLGRYHAEALLQLGLNIVISDINKKELNLTYKYLKKLYPKNNIVKYLLDVSSSSSIEKTLSKLKKKIL